MVVSTLLNRYNQGYGNKYTTLFIFLQLIENIFSLCYNILVIGNNIR